MFEEIDDKIISAIREGDLNNFKHLKLSSFDVNRKLKPFSLTTSFTLKNPTFSRSLKGPTALIFSVLCEQPSICEYIVFTKSPDLSISINGWTAVHFACLTKDTSCLSVLLKLEYVQQNIDFPIKVPTLSPNVEQTTSALHVAVSNKLYKTVLLLTEKEFPSIEISNEKKFKNIELNNVNNNNNNNDNRNLNDDNVNEDEEEEFQNVEYNHASVNNKATSGNTPLHIALYNKNFEMCKILLNVGADPTIKNSDNLNCCRYCKRLNLEEKFIKLMKDEIPFESIDDFIVKYFCDELKESEFSKQDEENEESKKEKEIKELKKQVKTLTKIVIQNEKEKMLISKNFGNSIIAKPHQNIQEVVVPGPCIFCGSQNSRRCSTCGQMFCDLCYQKTKHLCFL